MSTFRVLVRVLVYDEACLRREPSASSVESLSRGLRLPALPTAGRDFDLITQFFQHNSICAVGIESM